MEIPTSEIDKDVEVVIVLQNLVARDAMGYPIGYFKVTYGSFADDPLECGEELPIPERDYLG